MSATRKFVAPSDVAALAAGRHLVEVSKAGYDIWETEITIVDRDLSISVSLIPTAGQ